MRGVFRNEVSRARADRIAAAFAVLLWEDSAVNGRNDGIDRGARQSRPTVVAGYDERPSSPSIFSGLVAGLRRMGCHVIDIGLATKSGFWFAVDHVHAAGGVFVTGSGCEPAWTGVDFVRGDRPLSLGDGLERIRELCETTVSRPTRTSGTHRALQSAAAYEASLGKHFQGLRPKSVVFGCSSPLVRRTIERLFESLPCRLLTVELPLRVRNPVHRRDADVLRLSTAVRESQANLGILIDDDGQRTGFLDERGRHIPPAAIAQLLVPPLLGEIAGATILLEEGAFSEMRPLVEAMGARCQICPNTFAGISRELRQTGALYAGGDSGRHWFVDGFPTCDALLVLGRVLVALSRTDVPFSELAAG